MGFDIEKNVLMRDKMDCKHFPLLKMVELLHLETKKKTEDSMKPIVRTIKSLDCFKDSNFNDQEFY